MTRPPFEVADIVRTAGSNFRQRYWKALTWPQIKVLNAIVRCRTSALGGHRDRCDHCGYQHLRFYSCRNRHCPKCQTNAREKWLRRRQQELLLVVYFHIVFSVPHMLVPLVWQNRKVLFTLLFDASAAALLPHKMRRKKHQAAVELGRRGGKARAKNMKAAERTAAARQAALSRWRRQG
jgi:predicted Zn-ribbon and HTH transcriptional regulator